MYKLIKSDIIGFFTLTIFIIYMGASTILIESDLNTVVFFLVLCSFFLWRRRKLDHSFLIVLICWIAINVISILFINPNQNLALSSLAGVTIRLVMPYLMVKILGNRFWDRIVGVVYKLALVSLFLYPIQYFFPSVFFAAGRFLNFITQAEQKAEGGWAIIVYTFNAWAPYRNSGFAWEPGGFSCTLIITLCYHLARNKFSLDRKTVVFILSILTTLSTSGYLALFSILMATVFYRFKRFNFLHILMFGVFLLLSYRVYYEFEFLGQKVDMYVETAGIEGAHASGILRINRLEEFRRGFDQSLYWPFGNGILDSEYRVHKFGTASGSNSLSIILMQWGWLGIIALIYSNFISFNRWLSNMGASIFLVMGILVVLFSNPFLVRYLVYSTFFYAAIYSSRTRKQNFLLS